jgi:predicted deacetylase
MHYVILRDDDTNALTPVECLEQLYRPFLDRGLPVNLATIPNVRTDTISTNGRLEQYLFAKHSNTPRLVPLASNGRLVRYLQENSGYHVLQHGCEHSLFEFDSDQRPDIEQRLDSGSEELKAAGFREPQTFVAPYDRFSAASLSEAAKRYAVISAGWFELKRLPVTWWPRYALKKMLKRSHWKIGRTRLLTHPGCLLSYQRPYESMLASIKRSVQAQTLTVLVTHWWEYFRDASPDRAMLEILHATGDWLARTPNVRVISFDDLSQAGCGEF